MQLLAAKLSISPTRLFPKGIDSAERASSCSGLQFFPWHHPHSPSPRRNAGHAGERAWIRTFSRSAPLLGILTFTSS